LSIMSPTKCTVRALVLVAARQAARRARDFARADALRKGLAAHGITLDDVREGVRWKASQP